MKATIGFRLSNDIEERLNTLAKLTGRSKSYYVREAIIKQLESLEEIHLEKHVRDHIRKGKDKV